MGEVTWACEAIVAMEAAHAVAVLTAEASTWKAAMWRDGATLCIKDVED
jgi:hypothetical protein